MGYSEINASQETRKIGFSFHGTGKEFFGIWIVNILLSIVTLGIYSAWAKVRTKRYFNGNTELDGHRFDYHANPMSILKGRIIVVVVLVVLNLLSQLHPFMGTAVVAIYVLALPWLIIRGLSFNANMTSYRNVRFHFKSTQLEAAKAYILWPFAAMLSFGLLVPFASRANARFLGNGHSFGISKFNAEPPLKPYYRALGLAVVLVVIVLLVNFLLGFFLALSNPDLLNNIALDGLGSIGIFSIIITYIFFILAFFVYAARVRNINFSALYLQDGHRFKSTITARKYAWITVTNAILSIITIGLYIPWAKVRMANYLAANTMMIAAGDLDQFTADQTNDTGVTSGEFLDIEGYDFGF